MPRSVLIYISIFGTAAASGCGLSADVDPDGHCKTDTNGFSDLDMDACDLNPQSLCPTPAITIEIKKKCEGIEPLPEYPCKADKSHTDAFNGEHAATVGTITDKTGSDGRFELSEKQGNGGQCITNTENAEDDTCPVELLSKGERDSYKWQKACKANTLCTWKPGQKTIQITVTRPAELTEFGGEWVQMFKKDSWENITNEYEPFTFNDYGSKIPLAIFRSTETNPTTGQILSGTHDTELPEQTDELNVFMEMVEDGDFELKYGNPKLKANGDKWVAVEFKKHQLRVGDPFAAADSKKDIGTIFRLNLGDPNIYYQDHLDVAATLEAAIPAAGMDVKVVLPIFVTDRRDANGDQTWTSAAVHTTCYKSGNACPEAHSVCSHTYCSIERWNEIIGKLHDAGATVLGLIDSGKYIADYKSFTKVDGFYFGDGSITMDDENSITSLTVLDSPDLAGTDCGASGDRTCFKACAIGAPLFDTTVVDKCDTWVTLAASGPGANLGAWTPYSWYAYKPSAKWTAIVESLEDSATPPNLVGIPVDDIPDKLEALFDRGYGYVFLGDGSKFLPKAGDLSLDLSTHTHLTKLIEGIAAEKTGRRLRSRRLQTQDDGVVTTKYECDDTLFECQPVCMQSQGVTRTKVGDYKCSGEKPTHCSCRCYYDAYWTVENAAVVCKASMTGGDAQTVGDLVCITRGTPKPQWDPTEARTASDGERKLDVQRMRRPTEQCMAEYATQKNEQAVEVVETTKAPATTAAPVVASMPEMDLMASAVHVAVGAALLALA